MDSIRNGWFSEINELWPGQSMSLEVKEVLFHEKSNYQDVLIIETKNHGRCLVLDGAIQMTENDEFSYQEMLSMVPVNCHPNPERVLVIGGGDGGIVRELDKHPKVKSIVQCEIDGKVIEAVKKYIPSISKGFESPKLTLNVGDGFAFMKEHKAEFDVIITDSSDPQGPAVALFEKAYYELMKTALRPGGIICTQDYCYSSVPTYPSGQIGYTLCSLDPNTNFRDPLQKFTQEEVEKMGWRYYNTEIHEASFVLPEFARKVLRA